MVDDSRYSSLIILVGRYDLFFNLSKAFELWLISNEVLEPSSDVFSIYIVELSIIIPSYRVILICRQENPHSSVKLWKV